MSINYANNPFGIGGNFLPFPIRVYHPVNKESSVSMLRRVFFPLVILTVVFVTVSFVLPNKSSQNLDAHLKSSADTPQTSAKIHGNFLEPEDKIVFLVIDTLRADHLPFYGYDKNTAPFLNELAQRSVVFEKAISSCSSTAPSMASVFTSIYPSQHGVITGKRATQRLQRSVPTLELNRIPANLVTLGEMMKTAGYTTVGAADNLNIDNDLGFLKGFDDFKTFPYDGAPVVNETILSFKNQIADRTFLYIHYMDPHAPYHRRAPWFEKDSENSTIAAYNSEIRYTDEHIRALFDELNLLDNSLVVFLSDHGEEFGEHGDIGHGKNLYPETIHVPLMFYHRNLPANRIVPTVHLVDVLPTLAELVGVKAQSYWEGRSLVPYLLSGEDSVERPVFSQLLRVPEHHRVTKQSVVDGNWFYVESVKPQGTVEEFYDLLTDPLAQKPLSLEENAETTERLSSALRELEAKEPPEPSESVEIEMDNETVERLRTLGYI
jgi:arylsulfatase A-like enzyme